MASQDWIGLSIKFFTKKCGDCDHKEEEGSDWWQRQQQKQHKFVQLQAIKELRLE
jgi:hypothetical protein